MTHTCELVPDLKDGQPWPTFECICPGGIDFCTNRNKTLDGIVGKTIKSITRSHREYSYEGTGDIITIVFTDDTQLEIESFDYEGYSSAMEIKIL